MTLKVRILPRAKTDFRTIFAYIEEHSPAGAQKWREAFTGGIDKAASNPEQFAVAPEDGQTKFTLRQMLFKTPARSSVSRGLYRARKRAVDFTDSRGRTT